MGRSGVDYADYNITVYRSPCPYRCVYCWAWRIPVMASRISRGKYNPIDEAKRVSRRPKGRVVVSFTSDPYPPEEVVRRVTRSVIHYLVVNSPHTIMVLTKNPINALNDVDIYWLAPRNASEVWVGTTITSADSYHPFSTLWEPHAPRTRLRLEALRFMQKHEVNVWLSLEPLIPVDHFDVWPESLIVTALEVLDLERIKLVVLGRLNYISQLRKSLPFSVGSEEDVCKYYREHVPLAIDILKQHGIPYHIKKELQKCLEGEDA